MGAVVPGLGIVPATLKIVLGVIQTIAALAVTIFCALAACCSKAYVELHNRGVSHLQHGLGNICAGTFEAIPLVGSIICFFRFSNPPPFEYRLDTGQEDRFMRYKCLVEMDQRVLSAYNSERSMSLEEARKKTETLTSFAYNSAAYRALTPAERQEPMHHPENYPHIATITTKPIRWYESACILV